MKRRFNPKMPSYFNCWGILMLLSVMLFSCSKKVFQYKKECEYPSSESTKGSSDPGNYYYVMKMSMEKYKSLKGKVAFKRFIFQYKKVDGKNGRNEYEMNSYAWKHGLFSKMFIDTAFLTMATEMPLLKIEPTGPYSFVNLELWHKHINKKAFKNATYIYLIPYYDKCKKVMSLKMVGDSTKPNPNTVGYRNRNDKTNPNYAMNVGYKITANNMIEGKLTEEQLMGVLALGSELEINPCPPDIPHGR